MPDAADPGRQEPLSPLFSLLGLHNLEVEAAGPVFGVKTRPADISINTCEIKLIAKGSDGNGKPVAAEFSEAGAELRMGE